MAIINFKCPERSMKMLAIEYNQIQILLEFTTSVSFISVDAKSNYLINQHWNQIKYFGYFFQAY